MGIIGKPGFLYVAFSFSDSGLALRTLKSYPYREALVINVVDKEALCAWLVII